MVSASGPRKLEVESLFVLLSCENDWGGCDDDGGGGNDGDD